jgi:hypothetical protein
VEAQNLFILSAHESNENQVKEPFGSSDRSQAQPQENKFHLETRVPALRFKGVKIMQNVFTASNCNVYFKNKKFLQTYPVETMQNVSAALALPS